MGKILVVDDDPELSEVVGLLLREAGHDAAVACTADDALALAKSLRPDLILADWNMPGGGANELRVRLEAAGIEVALIVMTGMPAVADEMPVNMPFAGVLPKPFDVDRLLELAAAWSGSTARAPVPG